MRIGELRRVLRESGVLGEAGGEPAPAELADALWLAALRQAGRPAPPAAEGVLGKVTDSGVTQEHVQRYQLGRTQLLPAPEPDSAAPPDESVPASHAYVTLPVLGVSPGVLVSAAARPQLLETLPLARAMRPLRRRVPSSTRLVLDEEATAELRAEQRMWLPALIPGSEPAFDLALVVDDSESMALWGEKVREFWLLCGRIGAFRDVRLWRLGATGADGQAKPVLRGMSRSSAARDERELIDSSGRRLILVVTDGVNPWWRPSGPLRPVLARWALASPLAIVQPFPQRLWNRSPLRPVVEQFRPGWPGSGPTIRYKDDEHAGGQHSLGSVAVPVLELSPAAMRRWAGIISSTSGLTPLPAAILPRQSTAEEEPRGAAQAGSGMVHRDPARLVRDFRASVSPAAYQLAGYLSAAPLTLPVMRLVQESTMPQTGPAELAEVFLSGLLRRSAETSPATDTESALYVFAAGVRDVLQSTLTKGEILTVYDQVGSYLVGGRHGGRPFPIALGSRPAGDDNVAAAFGRISGKLMERIGGRYATAIKQASTPQEAEEDAFAAQPEDAAPSGAIRTSIPRPIPAERVESGGSALVLQAVEVRGPSRWRWLLTDGQTGVPLADHEIALDPGDEQVRAFGDVYEYVRTYAAPDRRAEDEQRLVAGLGAWAGRVLLGERIGMAIVGAAPVTVRVTAGFAAGWPLELAHVDGVPLAARGDVSFVYAAAASTGPPKAGIAGALRVLAVFSQPTRTSVLALRRERYGLERLIRRLAATQRRMVELTVVQYGATRERLARIADTGDGWDVLHLSGHGGPGAFLLEHADGSPDAVEVADLVEMLRPARRQVKLAVVAACESAAAVTAQTLRLIGLTVQAEQVEHDEAAGAGSGEGAMGMAAALVDALDCAVVAMRYPVDDEFAIGFGGLLYEYVLGRGQPVDVAVARALKAARGSAVSLATPGLFGARAAGLVLRVPQGTLRLDPDQTPTAYLPSESARFVGRAEAMARASAALASASGRAGVLLHGMAGAGKTSCAVELAYRHRDSFAAIAVWQAPTRADELGSALANLAITLETQLGRYGFAMTGRIGSVQELTAFLPRLGRVLAEQSVLLVLDQLETLLTAEGTWRDPRWDPLIAVLTGHDGESRVIMTSRIAPAGLGPHTLVLPVHALPLAEAVALARELPNLRGLLHAGYGPVQAPADGAVAQDRDRVRRVLRVVQGHPKLMELADAAAADRARLDAQLDAAERAAAGLGLDAFFRDGDSTLDPGQFLATLTGWTTSALDVLPGPARLMAHFLACLEDDDRNADVIEATWADLWRRLDQPGDPPPPWPLLDDLATAALAQPQDGTPVTYRVAAAITAVADPGIRDAADAGLAAYWVAVSRQARERESGEDSSLIAAAGLAAAPYLLRLADWDTAASLLENALVRDQSPGVVAAALPALRRTAAATGTPGHRFVLARALRLAGQAEAGPLLRDTLQGAAAAGDYRLASVIAGELAGLLREAGRLAEALAVTGQVAGYSERAGLGPWTQLLGQARRLQILAAMGEHERVLAETGVLRDRMGRLPARPGPSETVQPWQVREAILDAGYQSALALGRWQQCLDLNAEITASKRDRGAGLHELARTRFNDAGPLIRLGRLGEADRLLRHCQQVFEDHRDTPMLAMVLSTRASLENASGRPGAAADLERTAIRLRYARPDPRDVAISHHNLANYLRKDGGDRSGQRAHRLAAALLFQLTGMTHDLARTQEALTADLSSYSGTAALPRTLAEVIDVTSRTDGVRLSELIAALEPDPLAAGNALAQILRHAANFPKATT